MRLKIYIETLGCKLNQAESEELARHFLYSGARLASGIEEANLYILNTCAVTHEAERKARQLLRRARHLRPEVEICTTGCYARHSPAEIETTIEGVKILGDYTEVNRAYLSSDNYEKTISKESLQGEALASRPKTRSMLKIQDGCSYRCTYCIVPSIRGEGKSLPLSQIIDEVKKRVKEGYKEVVLTGTRVGSYKCGGEDLRKLLSAILSNTSMERLRLSSLQPQEIDGDLLSLWKDKRLCPHFHIPLQSGSDGILQKMGRRYDAQGYFKAIRDLFEGIPEANITTDIIAGFPGEEEKEFEESLELCQKIGFGKIHVFPYSPRPGTIAAEKEGQVSRGIKEERSRRMIELSIGLQRTHMESQHDKVVSVLWEKEVNKGLWSGLSEYYDRVYGYSTKNLRNSITPARIRGFDKKGLLSEVLS